MEDDETKPTRTMLVGTNEMEVVEEDDIHGIETSVTDFTLPEENLPPWFVRPPSPILVTMNSLFQL